MKSEMNKFVTSDLKLQAFLRLKVPSLFLGVDKSNPQRVLFVFQKSDELSELVRGYSQGKTYKISPLSFGNFLDEGKSLIFGNYEL